MPADDSLAPRRHRLQIAGRDAAYLESGAVEGPPVLLLHGFAGDSLTWYFNVTALAKSHRVVAPDLPGHGQTDADVGAGDYDALLAWLEAFVAALDLRPFHLVGHSMGGCLALGLALADARRVLSLGLLGPAGISPDFNIEFLESLLSVDDEVEAEASIARMCPAAGHSITFMARAHAAKMAQPEYRQALAEIAACLLRPAHGDPERVVQGWGDLSMPLKMIWGADDCVVPLPDPQWCMSHQPIVLPGVGHLPHLEAPARVNDELLSLMAQAS